MKEILILLFLINISVFSKVLDVGVILENNSNCSNNALEVLQAELDKNFIGTEYSPKITEKFYLTNHNIQEGINKLNSNKKIDAIFVLTCAPLENIKNINESKFYSIPFGFGEKQHIDQPNVNYIYSKLNLKNYIEIFKEIDGVNEINVLISNMNSDKLRYLEQTTKIDNLKVNVLNSSEQNLIDSNNKKIPSFLIDFNENIKPLSYSGLNLEKEMTKRLRAASLNYMFFKTGKGMGKIIEVDEPRKDIYLNSEIAATIGVYPNLIFLQEMSQVNLKKTENPKLTLKGAVQRALSSNVDLLQIKQDVFTSFYNVKVTNSQRLPQLSANMDYNALDDRSPSFDQGAATNSVNSFLKLSQVIFSDQINASVYIEKLALDSSRKQYEQEKLNVIYYVASTYVNILQLKAQLEIQLSNYKLLKETLDVAKINYRVGSGGLQDVYRLESDVASSLADIANVKGGLRSQELYLNNLLNYPEANTYTYQTLEDIAPLFLLSDNLGKNFSFESEKTKKIEKFLIEGALSNSNTLQQIDNNIKGTERQYLASKRERYLPTVQAFGNYNKDNLITPWGQNSNQKFQDEYWEAGISVSLPLISGGEIYYNNKKLESELKSLEYNKLSVKNELAQQVLQTYTKLLTNFVQSYTTRISADVAKKNLTIVKNLYVEGNITITDFLSAQTSTLTQELKYVIDNFNLINSTLQLENLYGKSSLTMDESERKNILNTLQREIEN
ncbi:TolC family protein [Cetobacterium sp. 8H]|uniref:TolC family protein n=1 Tax=Cetobacterium sp. 8H TaxID=2759681 RepID=UPI00163CDE76|nr:TolC family protein [Cetobacterium sp. 8H]MBC2850041.1 TolC family protein [Cetobacterium sp. 8H]